MTRFRAYQLGSAGSSFSYFNGTSFTLIEGRFNDYNKISICNELRACSRNSIDCLHITSWDDDHCSSNELTELLKFLTPTSIECPKYPPTTSEGQRSLDVITGYLAQNRLTRQGRIVNSVFVCTLPSALAFDNTNVVFDASHDQSANPNDQSTIKLFRSEGFSVLSLGDVESCDIANQICDVEIFQNEVDILILAHHGADNGFTTNEFLKAIRPSLAICSSNYDNEYEHPRPEIRSLLWNHDVPLMTTKTGDVIIESNNDGNFRAHNLIANSTLISGSEPFKSKRQQHKEQIFTSSLRNLLSAEPALNRKWI